MSSYRLITIQKIGQETWVAQDPLVPYSKIEDDNPFDAAMDAVEVANAWYVIEEKGNINKEDEVKVWSLGNSRAQNGMITYSISSLIRNIAKDFPIESERLTIEEAFAWVHVATTLKPGQSVSVGSWTISLREKGMKRKEFTGDFDGWEIINEDEIAKKEVAATKKK